MFTTFGAAGIAHAADIADEQDAVFVNRQIGAVQASW